MVSESLSLPKCSWRMNTSPVVEEQTEHTTISMTTGVKAGCLCAGDPTEALSLYIYFYYL